VILNHRCGQGTQLQLPLDPSPLRPGGLPLGLVLDGVHLYGANWSAHADGCSGSGIGLSMGPLKSTVSPTAGTVSAEHRCSKGNGQKETAES